MNESLRRFDNKTYLAAFFLLFGLIFVRYCYFGLEYYLQLDDYIQYHNFTAYNPDLPALIERLGLLSSRPLAGLADIYIWSRFYGCMIAAVAIISAMYAASGIFLHKVFSGRFGTGWLFFVVYALLPLGFEGSYWLSASTRIVVGLFFASASLLCFEQWCVRGKKTQLAAFALLQLISFCFYEQIVLFSGAATLVIMLCEAKPRNRRALWGFLMFLNAAIYLIATKLAPAGINAARSELYFPWQEGYFELLFKPLNTQLTDAFLGGAVATCGRGLLRGFKIIISEPNFLYILLVLALCAGLYFLAARVRRENVKIVPELLAGLFLALAPVLVFYVLKAPWFGFRNTLTSFCGLALVADALFDLLFGRLKKGAVVQAVLVSVLALLCCVASVSELGDYRTTYLADSAIGSAASDALDETDLTDGGTLLFLNVDASYVPDANIYFHEHGYGATSSDWAFTGLVTAIRDTGELPYLTPVSVHRVYPGTSGQLDRAKAFLLVGDSFHRVLLTPEGDDRLISSSGQSLGRLRAVTNGYMLELN